MIKFGYYDRTNFFNDIYLKGIYLISETVDDETYFFASVPRKFSRFNPVFVPKNLKVYVENERKDLLFLLNDYEKTKEEINAL